MSAVELLQKAVKLDTSGRMLEALKLYQSGIDELLKVCKSQCLLSFGFDNIQWTHYRSFV